MQYLPKGGFYIRRGPTVDLYYRDYLLLSLDVQAWQDCVVLPSPADENDSPHITAADGTLLFYVDPVGCFYWNAPCLYISWQDTQELRPLFLDWNSALLCKALRAVFSFSPLVQRFIDAIPAQAVTTVWDDDFNPIPLLDPRRGYRLIDTDSKVLLRDGCKVEIDVDSLYRPESMVFKRSPSLGAALKKVKRS